MIGRSITRRRFAAVSLAGLAASGGRLAMAQDPPPTVEIITTDGIAGGGTLMNLGHEVPFSLAVFAREQEGGEPVVQGTFRLNDSSPDNPVIIEGEFFNAVSAFSEEAPNARQIQGWARANGNGPFPFLLQVEDVGEPGSGEDTFNLVFGDAAIPFLGGEAKNCDCGGFSYSLRSNVVAGDLALFALG